MKSTKATKSILRSILLCVLITLPVISSLVFVSCKNTEATKPDEETVPETPSEEKSLVSEDGDIQIYPLGIEAYDSFGGATAADGNKIFVVYFEAVNKSPILRYFHRDYLSYRYSDAETELTEYPEGFSVPDGFIESGKRAKYCFAFEAGEGWKCLTVDYAPNWESTEATPKMMDIYSADAGNGISDGNTEYPVDTVDYSYILEKYVAYMKKKAFGDGQDTAKAYELLDSMIETENGYGWEDINYSGAYPKKHIENLQSICRYLGEDGVAALSEEYIAKFNSAIAKWIAGGYYLTATYEKDENGELVEVVNLTPKWFYTDIRTPRAWTAIMAMAGDIISDENIEGIYYQHHHCIFKRDNVTQYTGSLTGANLHNVLINSLYYYAYEKDIGSAAACFEKFYESIYFIDPSDIHNVSDDALAEITADEDADDGGIAPDGSFWQHFIANGAGYGPGSTSNTAAMLKIANEIGLEVPTAKLDILSYYVIESYKLTAHGNYGYMFVGRQNNHTSLNSNLSSLASALLLSSNTERREELAYVIADTEGETTQRASIKYFDDCLVSAMKTENVTMVSRGARNDTAIIEGAEDYNRLCRNTSYGGQTEFMCDGSEYVGLYGVWDWSLVPGTTAYHETDEELIKWELDNQKSWLNTFTTKGDYCDGASDESTSTVYLKMVNEEGLTAYKSYFSYNGIMVCLGTDITDTSGNKKEVNTTVDQTRYVDASVNGESIFGKGIVEITGGSAVKNAAFAYYNLGENTMYVTAEHRTGSVYRFCTHSKSEVEDDVLTLWFAHGVNPQDAGYAYAVADNGDGEAPDNAGGLGIKKITNTHDIQAVEFSDGTAIAVFHNTMKSLTLESGRTISAESEENRVVIVH